VGDFARGFDRSVEGMSSYFVWLNRSKESLTLDLKRLEGQEVLSRLIEQADIFIQNLAPGAAERARLGSTALRESYPRLITCDLSGYGSSGPYRDKKAYDLLVQCEVGVLSVTGTPDIPSKAGISIADISAGMYAFSGILLALYQRERTGEGSGFEVSLFDSLGEWMSSPAYYTAYSGSQPPRTGASHATIAPYGPFRAGDRKTVFLGLQNEREWERFCALVLGDPELATDPRFATNSDRVAHRGELQSLIEQAFSDLSAEAVIERLEIAGIANAHQNTPQEFWDHPQLQARHRWRRVASPVGPLQALLPPITLPGVEPRMDPIPEVGEHTDEILEELGYSKKEIEGLRADGIV
jgi:crotonobetainyl-CoA:carnitine CoA-transferase CaiB-like acyl-CoA transferase